ncbi:dienelactone hydrolase family protein [Arthrobacter nitrophenolicus]|uniref:Dienelactone hydrolase family protein n=2 Tax=Arthrobacter nitrophenolicus TaxID=683150 RepID=A0A4R5XR48_9MICC|nr:dienelactone hydrolase family protein [Arthrobacter nitrophenolicus]
MGNMRTLGNAATSVQAYISEPPGQPKAGLLLIHEIWGLVDHIKDVADRYAAEGYLVLVPDVMTDIGMTPEVAGEVLRALADPDPEQRSKVQPRLRKLTSPLDSPEFAERTLEALQVCFNHLEGIPGLAGRVAVTGFCFGGGYSFALATREPRLRAAVPFYGSADFTGEELRRITCPVLAFYGEQDRALVDKLPELKKKMSAAGVDFEAVVYPRTGHAFFNDSTPARYNAHAATDAWTRTLAFLDRSLRD